MKKTKINSMKDKITINIFFYILIVYSIVILLNDYITYIFNLNYIISLIISSIFTGILFYKLKNKINIEKELSKTDLIFFIFLIGILLITIVFPDRMYDTLNYHIYSQVNPFNQLLKGDFFPSRNINSYSYSFPDRLFYPIRLLLGYRLGTILNYFVLIILYYQVKKLIKQFLNNELFIVISSTIIVFSLSIIDLVDTYYIDLLSIIVLLEIFNNIFILDKQDINNKLIYMAFLSGLSFSIKISNAFMVIGLFIIFLINYRHSLKNINIKKLLLVIIPFIFPFLVYFIYSFIDTGNPFFPFYNKIFKSDYYPLKSWMDLRFGPKRILELLTWPVYMLKYKTRALDINIIEPSWAYGYLVAILYIIIYIIKLIRKKKINWNKLGYMLSLILLNLLWSKFMLGYTRYALFILIINSIGTVIFIDDAFKNKHIIPIVLSIIMITYNSYYFVLAYIYNAHYYTYNNIFGNGVESYKYNLTKLFSKSDSKVEFPKNSVWGVVHTNSGYMELINSDLPIISLVNSRETKKANKLYEKKMKNVKHIYTLADYKEITDFVNNLNKTEFKIKNIYKTYKPYFSNYDNVFYIIELEETNDTDNNTLEITNSKEFSTTAKDEVKLTGILGLDMNNINNNEEYTINIKDNDRIIKSFNIKGKKIIELNETIDTKDIDNIKLELVNKDNEILEYNRLITLNLAIN